MDELLSALKKADINVGYQDDNYNFLATMLHDLKNLITIIYLLSQIIEKSEFAENEDIQKIYKASKMAARLSQYAMASLKDLQLKLEKADLAEVLDEAFDILEYKFYSKNIKLNKNYEKNIFFAEIDKTQFTRVIINIILNSISVIDSKNGEISVSLSKKDKIIRLVFTDNGPGFPKEIIDGIKPYNTTRSDIGGTGLGLYSSMNIIKKLNGNLEISNQEKKGAKVSIELPELI
jgi:signal transduction histidine kinase